MIRGVLDTNVVVSGVINPEGPAALILALAMSKKFRCYVSEPVLDEYTEVLARARFRLDQQRVGLLLRSLHKAAVLVARRKMLRITSDPDDNRILECALEARADYVVTGNTRHFPSQFQDIRIISPQRFLTVVAAELP